jgi:hypothetical protein
MSGFFSALRAKLKAYDDVLESLNWEAIVASLRASFHLPPAACGRDDRRSDAIAIAAALLEHVAGSPKPPPRLCIQAWVPEPIARYFRESYEVAIAAGPQAQLRAWLRGNTPQVTPKGGNGIEYESLDIVAWLAGHGCMRAFYEELFRKNGGDYVYPAISPAISPSISEGGAGTGHVLGDDAGSRQAAAVIQLLDAAVQAAKAKTAPPLTKTEARQRYEIANGMYHLLRGYALDDFDPADREVLDSAAAVYRRRAEGYECEMESAPVYKSGHSRDRVFVVRIGEEIQRLFGVCGLYGTVANLATAALGHEIKVASVRKWLNGRNRQNTPL